MTTFDIKIKHGRMVDKGEAAIQLCFFCSNPADLLKAQDGIAVFVCSKHQKHGKAILARSTTNKEALVRTALANPNFE